MKEYIEALKEAFRPENMRKVGVTITGCIDIPAKLWEDRQKSDDYVLSVAEFRYNEQLTVEDAINELAEKLKVYPDDLEVRVGAVD